MNFTSHDDTFSVTDPSDPNVLISSGEGSLYTWSMTGAVPHPSTPDDDLPESPLLPETIPDTWDISKNLNLGQSQEVTFFLTTNNLELGGLPAGRITDDFITGLPSDVEVLENYEHLSAVALQIDSVEELDQILKHPDVIDFSPYNSIPDSLMSTVASSDESSSDLESQDDEEETPDGQSSDSESTAEESAEASEENGEIEILPEVLSEIGDKMPLAILDDLIDGEVQELLISFDSTAIDAELEGQVQDGNFEVGSDEFLDFKADLLADLKEDVFSTLPDGFQIREDYNNLPILFVEFESAEALVELLQNPDVIGADIPEIYEKNLAESLPLIDQPEAETAGYTGEGTMVAVLDTGADRNAPGLQGRVAVAEDFAPDDGVDDDNGHGTNVSAIVAGVAPDTQIAALDVFGSNGASDPDIIEAINWSIQNKNTYNIAAINMSLGVHGVKYTDSISDNESALGQAIANARDTGILPIVASGNDGYSDGIESPAAFESAISVGSVYEFSGTYGDDTATPDRVSIFSNSAQFLDVLAPGSAITAGGLSNYSGTSMAAPHVAGAIAVLREAFPGDSSEQILQRLIDSGDPIADWRNGITKNRINLGAALEVESSRPGNDNFADSRVLLGTSSTGTGTNVGATQQTSEPNHAGITGGRSVWWTWTAPSSGEVTVNTFGSNFDTLLAAYTGSSVSNLSAVASNDDSGGGNRSEILFDAIAGNTYHFAVDGYLGATGEIAVNLSLSTSGPLNDNLSESIALSGSSTSTTGSNIDATQESGEPSHAGTGGSSVWWNWTAPSSGLVTISTDGSDFDTVLGVYTGSSISGLTEIDSDDDGGDGVQSQVTFNAVAGTNYKIAVDGFFGAEGNINLDLALATSQLANDNFSDSASLSGTSDTATASSINASKESGEPDHAGNSGGSSVWWDWTAPASGLVTIDTFGSNFDTILAAYTGSSLSGLSEMASDDDSGYGLQSQITFPAQAGTNYKIAVDGYFGSAGAIDLALSLETNTLANDNFADSISLSGSFADVTGSNDNATKESGEPNHGGNSGGSSVWWNWTAPSSGTVTIDTVGSNFDTTLAAYTGSSVSNLTLMDGSDDSIYGLQSEIIFDVVAGTNYQIAVDGYGGSSGNINLQLVHNNFANQIDLTPDNFDVVSSQVGVGDPIEINYSVENTGSDDVDSGFWVDFFLSDDFTFDPEEDYLLSYTWVDSLAGNSSTGTSTAELYLPNAGDPFWNGDGEYWVYMLVDSLDSVGETDESNNIVGDVSLGYDSISITTSDDLPYTNTPVTINGSYEPVEGDFNGDNITDVLWYVPGATQDFIWFFNSDGSYESTPFTVNGSYTPIVGDYDGNEVSDILWYVPGTGRDYVWSFDKDGTYTSNPFTVNGDYTPIPGDYDGTGTTDILWYRPGTGTDYIWSFNDDGTYESNPFTVNGDYIPVQGDYDATGTTDILWYRPGTGQDYIWSFNPDGTYDSSAFTVNGDYIPVQGDYDGSSTTDILWYRPGTGQDYIWSFNPDGTYDSNAFTVNGDYEPVVGDFDGSSTTDILWYRPGTGQDYLWSFS